ncbi:hypothetical protein BN7_2692 [Wickerhamomyces ciferrii]|uniref:Zn(2)-C6 fungal-type domain-containing protein n=1 Tax=Wickerhamomyces ciferrii (strain ATCC 14091 / BCRC 22168 / CBS 111 / JCM 3599 / NBRC 0793 / NRRL Y-1031 F-60-10) TaxID=1206466 RepID=K0KDF6_WICCF|nr:uncharacterized protein BN7_2692 [Wickerhamomyces ciferrii]CCH43145.1 hypothetical protein BN7_2692 [Wickerhamomyces ciferrii]
MSFNCQGYITTKLNNVYTPYTMSFIISNNNRLLLLPSLETPKDYNSIDLQYDLNKFKFNNASSDNYNNIKLPRLSITEDNYNYNYDSKSSRSSIFSNESDDGFSSNDEDFNDEEPKLVEINETKSIDEKKLIPIEPIPKPTPNNSNESIESNDSIQSNETELQSQSQPQPEHIPQTKRHSITPDEPNKSKRQRIGPSCDLCRSKKIKCDAHVEIIEFDIKPDTFELTKTNEIMNNQIISKYLTSQDLSHGFKLKYCNNKIIKFKDCSYCSIKNHPCIYERGYTKDDIMKYNLLRNIKKKKKTSRKRRS